MFIELNYLTTYPDYNLVSYTDIDRLRPQQALKSFELVLSFDANLIAAQEKVKLIKQYLANQA